VHAHWKSRWASWMAIGLLAALAGCAERPGAPPESAGEDMPDLPWSYRLVERRDPGLEELEGVAVGSDGRRYLACGRGVIVFDNSWNRLQELPTPNPATAVAVAPDGRVFVTERQNVHVFGPEGGRRASWAKAGEGEGRFSHLTGIALLEENVYVADAGARVVHRYDTTGDFIADLGGRDPRTGEPGILCPSPYLDCAAGPSGMVYVNNPGRWRVEWYDLNNRRIGTWGKQGLGVDEFVGCCNPTNLAVTPDGQVVTAEKGRPRIKVSDPDGRPLAVIGQDHFTAESRGIDVAVDPQGRIVAVDPARDEVLVFVREDSASE